MEDSVKKSLLSIQVICEWMDYNRYFLKNCRSAIEAPLIRTNADKKIITDKFLKKLNNLIARNFGGIISIDIVEFDLTIQRSVDFHKIFFNYDEICAMYKLIIIPHINGKRIFGKVSDNRLLYLSVLCPVYKIINFNLYKPIILDLMEDIKNSTEIGNRADYDF
jgi:hypothetical protein